MKRQHLKRLLEKYFPVFLYAFFFVIIFRKVFFQALYPYPGDLLVSFFFPYNSGGWDGYTSWVAHKEYVAADVVRQLYPWRNLAIDLLKGGVMPLWNPYAFSGTPLAANLQTAAFYPLNIIFFLLPFFKGWMVYILLQPILGGIGMYLFIRSLSLSRLSSTFSAFAFGFMGYFLIWFELGVVGHTAAWLPFILWGITRYSETKRLHFLLLSSLSLSFSLLAGHAQTAVYVFLVSTAYYLYRIDARKGRQLFHLFLFLGLGIGIAAVQLLPSIELLLFSARNAPESLEIFHRNLLPLSHLVTAFAPDFFGNQTTNNYWGKNYGEFMAFIGIVALTFAVIGGWRYVRDTTVRFILGTIVVALLFALPGPFSEVLLFFHIPVLSTGIPARALFLVCFGMVVLSAYGIESVFVKKQKDVLKPLLVLFGVYLLLWGVVFILPRVMSGEEIRMQMAIAQRNLILPTAIFVSVGIIVILIRRFPKFAYLGFLCLFVLGAVEYQYFMYKFLPFAPEGYLYPPHPVVMKLQESAGNNRVFGYETARLETNLPTQWRVLSPEGYDPLYIKRYGELITSSKMQQFSQNIPRSDATLPDSPPVKDTEAKQRLLNILGVKYVVAKDDNPASDWEPNPDAYPPDRFSLVWQERKWKLFENSHALPRAAVFYSWEVPSDAKKEFERIMAKDFPYRTRLTLGAGYLNENITSRSATPANIKTYSPNEVVIDAHAEENGVLFLSDVHYPGWRAYVDDNLTDIFQVDYAFRGVPLMKGKHTVVLHYQPMSFYLGAFITGMSSVILILLLGLSLKGGKPTHAKHQ